MTSLKYTPEKYEKKLRKLLECPLVKQNTKSKDAAASQLTWVSINSNCSDRSPSRTTKHKPIKRRATPYHISISRSKLSNKRFKGQQLFSSSNSDCFNSDENIDEERTATSIDVKQAINKKSLKSKSVKRSGCEQDIAKIKERQSVPSTTGNKKLKCSARENKRIQSPRFPAKSDSDEFEDEVLEQPQLPFPSTSGLSFKNNLKYVQTKQKGKEKMKGNKCARTESSNESEVDVGFAELICDNDSFKNDVAGNNLLFTSGSDSEDSDELYITNHDCSSSIVCDNIDLPEYNVEGDSFRSVENNDTEELNSTMESNGVEESFLAENHESEVSSSSNLDAYDDTLQLNKHMIGEADYYSLKDALLIVLHRNSKLYFHGLMSVTILHGVTEVLGCTLTPSSSSVNIFSPRGSSFLYFETKDSSESSVIDEHFSDTLTKLGMQHEMAQKLFKSIHPESAVIVCKKIDEIKFRFLERHTSQQLFPNSKSNMPQCVFENEISNWNVLKCNVQWNMICSNITSSSKTLICGGKNVGKSTLLRYIVNKLLSKYSEVLVIDLDPGQPEFTISGCISATVVKEPLLGPNYTHLRKPYRCVFIPSINISYEPDGYLACVKELILSCANLPKIPTVINYMGFTGGLGLEILSAIVAYVQPTDVIEVESSGSHNNFRRKLTYQLIVDKSRLLACSVDYISHFNITTISSMTDTKRGFCLQPRQIRELCVLAYLSEMLSSNVLSLTDTTVSVFVIDLSLVKIICNGQIVHPSIVNANLVALCSENTSRSCYVCAGWGVVRGFNLSTHELFLLTPVPLAELQEVDCIILGSVSLPPSLYMTAENNTGLVPYVSQGILSSKGRIPKRSHLPSRRTYVKN